MGATTTTPVVRLCVVLTLEGLLTLPCHGVSSLCEVQEQGGSNSRTAVEVWEGSGQEAHNAVVHHLNLSIQRVETLQGRLHHPCTTPVPPLHPPCTTAAPPLHHPCTTPACNSGQLFPKHMLSDLLQRRVLTHCGKC